ncbi:MAG: hypothetical protein KDE27_32460 [Planctomycetes bacterium]|nr:hypothetical protein [Planctomycetota bacterium]
MRLSTLLSLVLPAAGLAAQANNPFVFFPQDPERHTITSASYVGRPDWNSQAEGFQEIRADWFRGVGDENGVCLARGFYHWAADEDISTSETYGIVLRNVDPATGLVDPNLTGEITRVSGLTTPTNPVGGRGSWIMTDVFATPAIVPCSQTWFMGVDLPANPNWPATDGHALWRADIPTVSPATVGEWPRAGAPDANWSVRPLGGGIFSNGWSYLMGVLVAGPTLHVGGLDPNNTRQGQPLPLMQANTGLGGLFPDVGGAPRSDGITIRVQDNVATTGLAFIAATPLLATTPLPLPGITGQLHLDIGTTVSLGFGAMAGGAVDFTVLAPGAIGPAFVGTTLGFQAVVFDPVSGSAWFTNAQTTNL